MSLISWNPVSELELMRQQMDRMFNHMGAGRLLPRLEATGQLLPSVDVYTNGKEAIASIELPGFRPEDITVEVTEEAIHISGESKREQEIKEDNYYRSERQYGRFDRIIPLPQRIKDAEAKANFKNGVLSIRAPLAVELKRPRAHKLRVEST